MRFVLFFGLLFVSLASTGFSQTALKTQKDSRQEAERLWEQAIAAKGGRERLYAVENMVVSARFQGHKNLVQKVELPLEEFFVFPNKIWRWNDTRRLGMTGRLAIELFDLDRNFGYLLYPDYPNPLRKNSETYAREEQFMFYTQLLYLMETKWQKPNLRSARTERIGFKKYAVVQTVVSRERVDFYFDRTSHLPVKIVKYYVGDLSEEGSSIKFNLEDYKEVNGIQMPQKVEATGAFMDGTNYVKQQINVAYDKNLFERPPSLEAGAEAWKIKD